MVPPLRVLVVEDSQDDAVLLIRTLARGPWTVQWTRVETEAAMREALARKVWDLVVSDYSLPGFGAPAALALLRASGLDLPFIIVSGTVGEETAVAALKAGAHDFLPKAGLARLVPAVERELRESEGRRQRRAAEDALRASEARYRLLFERNLAGVYRGTLEGRLLDCNDSFARIYGYTSREEALAVSALDLYRDPAGRDELVSALRMTGHVINFESQGRRKDGTAVWVLENASLVRGDRDQAATIEGTVIDLTERRNAEEALRSHQLQLIQAQKLEAVGRLAGGVAHDFNNLLQAMLSTVQVLRATGGTPELPARLQELEGHVRRGAQLVRQLLLFSRAERPETRRIDLNELLRGAAGLLRRLLAADIAIELDLGDEALAVEADPGQVEQVIINLAVNAADAMPRGGSLTFTTGSDVDSVWLAVADTGSGIPEAALAHVFEPFFTTKPAGRGTGLGLSVVHGIVTRHGGLIDVATSAGAGTTFTVRLPRAASGAIAPTREEATPGLPRGRGERILVVEDEDAARAGLAEILGLLGYGVVAVASGEEAAALPDLDSFDLMITDLMLPGVSGPDLARSLLPRLPDLAVVLMSGYAVDEVMSGPATGLKMTFLQKPFDMAALAVAVAGALARR